MVVSQIWEAKKTEKQRSLSANIYNQYSESMKNNSKQILPKKKHKVNPSDHQPVNKSIPVVITVDSSVTSYKKKVKENISESRVSPFKKEPIESPFKKEFNKQCSEMVISFSFRSTVC